MPEKNHATAPIVLPCLSILQPWSHFICHGPKDIENRTWNSKRRGTFLVHAGKQMSKAYLEDACGQALACGVKRRALPILEDLPLGGIVGAAEILEVLPPGSASKSIWHQGDFFGFVLGRRIALPFRPLKGARQFFPVEITDAEAKALRAAGLLQLS
jgi:hypothetical protein